MLTFNIGPSQLHKDVKQDFKQLLQNNILSISHRSKEFTKISQDVHIELRKLLQIPDNYKIFYLPSATQAMEVILRNFVISESFHLVNGAFSEKFYQTALDIHKKPLKHELLWGEGNFSLEITIESELICLTQNETSTGVYIPNEFIRKIREKFPDKLIAVDVVSSIGGLFPVITDADIRFFSVQKCFGLPAGLAILIVNDIAIQKMQQVYTITGDIGANYSLINMLKYYNEYQTNDTPNVLNIYLLAKQLARFNNIGKEYLIQSTRDKYHYIHENISNSLFLQPGVISDEYRSPTTYLVRGETEYISKLKNFLSDHQIIIGSGYGKWKSTSLRIANFPAIHKKNLEKLFYWIAKSN